ncbi:MAG: adenosine deaminase [Erysipelotrichaceae bacterium]|nr:adenosine deaminase [Erysipelotrichaceae bacterium]
MKVNQIIEQIEKLKKVELHLHLDGSISTELASKLSGLSVDEVKKKMIAKDKCENLSEYLTKFDFPIGLMQTKENLTLIAKDLVDKLASQEVIYAEIRFAPMFHTKGCLTYEEIIEAVLEGLKSNSKIKTNLILCMMRGMNKEANLKTIEVAKKYLNKGVCAIDLAGAEDKYPIDNYLELFKIAHQKGIPFTIHAGENGSAEEVKKAIQVGATRIGHGIHSIEDEKVLNLIKTKNILLEICPTSNVQTNAVKDYNNHPIYKLYQLGIPLNINTDNSTVSNISLNEEYLKVSSYFNFTLSDYQKMNLYAINSAFLSKEEKEEIMKKLSN